MKKINNENIDRFKESAPGWDDKPGRIALAEEIYKAIIKSIPLSKNMISLEIGAGTGLLTMPFSIILKSIAAFDTSQGMLDVLKKKVKAENIENIEIHCSSFPDESTTGHRYDFIYSAMTFHHIENIDALIKDISTHLANGGLFTLADLEKEDGCFHKEPAGVFHYGFDIKELTGLIQKAGLEVISARTIHTITKPTEAGQTKDYPVFLLIARKSKDQMYCKD